MTATDVAATRRQAPAGASLRPGMPSPLVGRLASALAEARIPHCQWKSGREARLPGTSGDLDLLVERSAAGRLGAVMGRLGFKLALPGRYRVPGVASYLAPDWWAGRLLHAHVHHHLVIGRAWGTHYRVPIERAVLGSAGRQRPFPLPSVELDLLLLILRSTLRHRVRDCFKGTARWLLSVEPQLRRLERAVGVADLSAVMAQHLPDIDPSLLVQWRESLTLDCPPWRRLTARLTLEHALAPYARRPDAGARLSRATGWLGWQPIGGAGKRLVSGGAVIGVVGTDGSGKSTCTRELVDWLGRELAVRHAHVGKPPRSLTTLAAGLALKLSRKAPMPRRRRRQLTAHFELLRYVATARDRFRLCRKMRRFARGGGLAFCERYPVPECHAFSGPSLAQDRATVARSRLATMLRRIEARYYARIPAPDLLVVLEADPDTAVARKTDEPAAYVRARAELMRNGIDWGRYTAIVIDATAPLRTVMAELRCRLWEAL